MRDKFIVKLKTTAAIAAVKDTRPTGRSPDTPPGQSGPGQMDLLDTDISFEVHYSTERPNRTRYTVRWQ